MFSRKFSGDRLRLGDLVGLDRALPAQRGELDGGADGIVGLCGGAHEAIILDACRLPLDRRMSLRRSPLRGDRAAALCRLLPLHTLPAAHWNRGLATGPARARLVPHVKGAELVTEYAPLPDGFHKCFCSNCGGALWSIDPASGEIGSVRMGSLDPGHEIRPSFRTFVDYAADGSRPGRRPRAVTPRVAPARPAARASFPLP